MNIFIEADAVCSLAAGVNVQSETLGLMMVSTFSQFLAVLATD